MLHKDFKWVIAPSSLINNSELKRFKILINAKIHIPSRNSIMDAHLSVNHPCGFFMKKLHNFINDNKAILPTFQSVF